MLTLRKFIEKINTELSFEGELRYDEPMASHTTFKVGGPADIWIRPGPEVFPVYAAALLRAARLEGIPVFVLGGGANIVVSDRGIRGIVLDTSLWTGWEAGEGIISVRSGSPADSLAAAAAVLGLGGLEFLAGLPGSAGGAVWMNARCYGKSVSDIFIDAEILDENQERAAVTGTAEGFAYKKSPFQGRDVLILSCRFRTSPRDRKAIETEMAEYRRDREAKGHYRLPSAGSAFKNDYDYGVPSGKIIDDLGFKGYSRGRAKVSDWHANIIVNTGGAAASDIRVLVDEIADAVYKERGLALEPEILFVGDWS